MNAAAAKHLYRVGSRVYSLDSAKARKRFAECNQDAQAGALSLLGTSRFVYICGEWFRARSTDIVAADNIASAAELSAIEMATPVERA